MKKFYTPALALVGLLLAIPLFVQHRSISSEQVDPDRLPTRSELNNNFRANRTILFVYPASNPALRKIGEMLRQESRWTTYEIRSDQEITDQELEKYAVMVMGSPAK